MIRKTVAMDEDLAKELDHFAKSEERDFSSALRYVLEIFLLASKTPICTWKRSKISLKPRSITNRTESWSSIAEDI